MECTNKPCSKKRACIKIGVIILTALLVIAGLTQFVTDQALDEFKHNLSLGTIIALVIIINLISFICFLILFTAYQWVKHDLKPKKEDILEE